MLPGVVTVNNAFLARHNCSLYLGAGLVQSALVCSTCAPEDSSGGRPPQGAGAARGVDARGQDTGAVQESADQVLRAAGTQRMHVGLAQHCCLLPPPLRSATAALERNLPQRAAACIALLAPTTIYFEGCCMTCLTGLPPISSLGPVQGQRVWTHADPAVAKRPGTRLRLPHGQPVPAEKHTACMPWACSGACFAVACTASMACSGRGVRAAAAASSRRRHRQAPRALV